MRCCLLAELVVSHNLLTTLPTWGPTFKVSVDIFINSFHGQNLKDGAWAEILRFTNTTNNRDNLGDRLPAVFTHKDGYIIVASQIGDNNNYYGNAGNAGYISLNYNLGLQTYFFMPMRRHFGKL